MPRVLLLLALLFAFSSIGLGYEGRFYLLPGEPMIRIGLSTNSGSVTITTSDSQLVAYSLEEPNRFLETNRVSVSARAYRPPEVENYRFEIQNIATSEEADDVAKEVREATGETALVSIDTATNTWKIWVGGVFATLEEADAFRALLAEKGFEDAVKVTEKKTVISEDAVALSQQVRQLTLEIHASVVPSSSTRRRL